MADGTEQGHKKTRRTNTAAGKHKPVSRLASFPSSALSASGTESRLSSRFKGSGRYHPFSAVNGSPSRKTKDRPMHYEMQVPQTRSFLYWLSRSEPVLVMLFALWTRVGVALAWAVEQLRKKVQSAGAAPKRILQRKYSRMGFKKFN
ncbi:MAG: hypothetical protein RBR41_14500 [Desulfovibrio sp.]|uniref:hypothetical protein n=1 Tax=Desulfovibrio sp. TaxID=885 RepID=UPI002A35C81F|nr:hypothetical protein [Desulfovibrio sp.]MDY0260860.1 hypothetical protein [Desulfovibrio sp.]